MGELLDSGMGRGIDLWAGLWGEAGKSLLVSMTWWPSRLRIAGRLWVFSRWRFIIKKKKRELSTRSGDGYLMLCCNNDQIHGMILRPDCRVQLSTYS